MHIWIEEGEDFPVEVLFCDDLVHGPTPTTLCRLLKDYLVLQGFQYKLQPDINRLPNCISYNLVDEEYKICVYPCIATLRTRSQQPCVIYSGFGRESARERKIAYNIAQGFKKEDPFTDWLEYIQNFFEKY